MHKKTRTKLMALSGHSERINTLLCISTSQGKHIWSGSTDKTILIWNSKTYCCLQELRGDSDVIKCIHRTPKFILSCGSNNTIISWNYTRTALSGRSNSSDYETTNIGELAKKIRNQREIIENLKKELDFYKNLHNDV
eukprot:TRINITY_DN10527_c0_g1_i1.p1 TRINITY_DN10527_c0_g1~~TRINITY_DN10527_c0_g1_i1.p1  ORF type:complete len:138 (-),score=11.09 TRINITY_DN10527_c0_g1_i1:10-423(-)